MVVNGEVIEIEELSLLMGRMCLCDDAEDTKIEVSRSKRKNVETEKEQSDIAQPLRKRIRITQDHGKEPSSRPQNMHAPIQPALATNELIEEPRLLDTLSKNGNTFLRSPRSADGSCDPGIMEGVPGSDDSNRDPSPLRPLILPPPALRGLNQRQVVDQAFPDNMRYTLNSNPDMWSRGQPSYAAADYPDTVDFSDDESEFGVELSSPEMGREGSLALLDMAVIQTRNAIPKAYMDALLARKEIEVYDDSEDEVESGMMQPPKKRVRTFKDHEKGWLSEVEK